MDQTFLTESISTTLQRDRGPASSPRGADAPSPAPNENEQAMLTALRARAPNGTAGEGGSAEAAPLPQEWPSLDDVSMCYIRTVLEHVGGNKAKAARILGMARRTLERILARAKKGRSPAMHTRV